MKNILLIFVFYCLCNNLQAQTDLCKSEVRFQGKLISRNVVSNCNEKYFLAEFKVISFYQGYFEIKTNLKAKIIFVLLPCKETYIKDFFEKGKIYSMEIKPEFNEISQNKELSCALIAVSETINKHVGVVYVR